MLAAGLIVAWGITVFLHESPAQKRERQAAEHRNRLAKAVLDEIGEHEQDFPRRIDPK